MFLQVFVCPQGEGMHGRGACVVGGWCVWRGACVEGGCAWRVCVWQGSVHATHTLQQILQDTVNERKRMHSCLNSSSVLVRNFSLVTQHFNSPVGPVINKIYLDIWCDKVNIWLNLHVLTIFTPFGYVTEEESQ